MDEIPREDQIDEDLSSPPVETQPRAPSNLFFATFTPPGSSGIPGIDSIAKQEPSLFHPNVVAPNCRIALIPDPSNEGEYLWTFVPRAKGAGMEPNTWPQEVIVFGYVLLQEFLSL